jgi:RNA-directed DNA polymerase
VRALRSARVKKATTCRSAAYQPSQHPVIVLIDNDSGAKEIFSVLSSIYNTTATLTTDVPFYHLGGALYLVKTSAIGVDGISCIETFLPARVLQTVVNGKTFSPNKKHQAPGEYGKVVLAEQVVRPNAATIDFTGFEPLLTRLDAVMAHYRSSVKAS